MRPRWPARTDRLAEEQAALRRVATLVASSAQPKQVFQMVAEEAGRLLAARTAATVRFDEESAVVVGSWSDGEGAGIEVGTLVPYSDPESPVYRATHEGGRIDDYAELAGEAARLTRLRGYRSAVMAPITAGGRLWGALAVFSASANHFPADAEQRLADFTNLVALALEAAEAHDQLTACARASSKRVAERRRLERNLHDGAQQRLVTLAVHLRIAQETLRDDPAAAEQCSRQRRRGPEARARGAPRARPRPSSGSPQRPRPRTGPPVTREPRPVPGSHRRRSLAPSRRRRRSSRLLPRRREPDQRGQTRRCVRGARRDCDTDDEVVVTISDNGAAARAPTAARDSVGSPTGSKPRWPVRARESFRGRNARPSDASARLTSGHSRAHLRSS